MEELVTASSSTSAAALAKTMGSKNVGSVLITDSNDKPLGIVTDRDLAVSVLGAGRSPEETLAGDIMSADLATVDVSDGVTDVCETMRQHGVRRMPVMEGESVVGILTLDDLVMLLEQELDDISSVIQTESPSFGD